MPSSAFISGGQMPPALQGRRAIASSLTRPEDFVLRLEGVKQTVTHETAANDLAAFVRRSSLDAYTLADRMAEVLALSPQPLSSGRSGASGEGTIYPTNDLGEHLRLIARLIKASIGTRIYYTRQSGYDTHSGQLGTHAGLLQELSSALLAFLDDLAAAKAAERAAVLIFSEFGRTVAENASAGTDHGTSAPVFLAGPGVKPGLVGVMPSLLDLDPKHGDLRVSVDFRQVYATILRDWLGLPARTALAGDFTPLPLFKA
jgi:uncharacterized protein (DUF1501 family)